MSHVSKLKFIYNSHAIFYFEKRQCIRKIRKMRKQSHNKFRHIATLYLFCNKKSC